MSLKWKINLLLIIIGVTTSLIITAFNYYQAKDQIFKEALAKAHVISSFAMATRNYTVKTMRPLAVKISGKESFHPEIMGGFFVARSVANIFSKAQPGYSFKQATTNPVNIKNRADMLEIAIIDYFYANPEEKIKKGIMEKSSSKYFYIAKPVIAKKGCLKCHGSVENAPKGRVTRYPGLGGYDWQLDEVVATFITYVPIQQSLEEVKSTAIRNGLIGICGILLMVLAIWFFISKFVTKPISHLTQLADEISQGKQINREIKTKSSDEIGALYKSFNRMRISVIKLIKAVQQKK